MDDCLLDLFDEPELTGDDLFAILDSLDNIVDISPATTPNETAVITRKEVEEGTRLVSQKSTSSLQELSETEPETTPKIKKQKISTPSSEEANPDGQLRMSHITVERNRRKQMNEHLSALRSLMPCFYVKRVSKTTTSYYLYGYSDLCPD